MPPRKGLDALTLKLIAMALMFCDHLWATLPGTPEWLTAAGRLAFPIFAFQIAEGFAHTRDRTRYGRRLLLFALISELPFNLLTGGGPINPLHQNVLFTFLLAFVLMQRMENARARAPRWRWYLRCAASGILGFAAGYLLMTDYYGAGVLTVLVFYWTRRVRFAPLWQLLALGWINLELLGGYGWEVTVLGVTRFVPQQGLALLALPLIWLYDGRPGRRSRALQAGCYWFYPAHMLVLALVGRLL